MSDGGHAGGDAQRLQRIEAYAGLRAAHRALAGSSRDVESPDFDARFRELRPALRDLARFEGSAMQGDERSRLLAAIDRQLWELAARLRECLDAIPLSQLRASLSGGGEETRADAAALLDLCLGAVEIPYERVECLVTFAASEVVEGDRVLISAPSSVTQRMCDATSRAAESSSVDKQQIVGAFRSALDELTSADSVWPVVDRVRALKQELGPSLLVPEILEAAVAYNLAVWNRRLLITRSHRVVEDAECVEIEEPQGEEPEPSRPKPSLLEHPGVVAVVAALREHLIGRPLAGGLAAEIVAEVKRSSFSLFEASVLRETDDDSSRQVVRTAVAIGLIARAIPTKGDRLSELEIDPAEVESAWKPEIGEAIQRVVRECVADERHADARRLAEVGTKYLHAASDSSSGFRRETAPAQTPAARARSGARAPAARPQARARRDEDAERARRRERVKAAVGVLLLGVALGIYLFQGSESNVVVFSAAELAQVSPWLESGYRNRDGTGPLFIGTLKEDWIDEPDRVRTSTGREIGEALSSVGVEQVMLFDQLHRLQVHYRNDEVRLPARGQ